MTMNKIGSGESKLETIISILLMTGVVISLILEIIGVIMLYREYGNLAISHNSEMYVHGNDFFTFMFQQFSGKSTEGSAIQFMTAGIIVLILTPYLRLIASTIYFGGVKNIKFVFITLIVLVILTASMALH
jgi:uncharacterized membrane protein